DRVVERVRELFEGSRVGIWLVEGGGAALVLRARAGAEGGIRAPTRIAVGEGIVGRVAATRAPEAHQDVESAASRSAARERAAGAGSVAAVPLSRGEAVVGVLGLELPTRRRFAEEEIAVLRSLADHAAIALENARLYGAAREQSRELEALDEV